MKKGKKVQLLFWLASNTRPPLIQWKTWTWVCRITRKRFHEFCRLFQLVGSFFSLFLLLEIVLSEETTTISAATTLGKLYRQARSEQYGYASRYGSDSSVTSGAIGIRPEPVEHRDAAYFESRCITCDQHKPSASNRGWVSQYKSLWRVNKNIFPWSINISTPWEPFSPRIYLECRKVRKKRKANHQVPIILRVTQPEVFYFPFFSIYEQKKVWNSRLMNQVQLQSSINEQMKNTNSPFSSIGGNIVFFFFFFMPSNNFFLPIDDNGRYFN